MKPTSYFHGIGIFGLCTVRQWRNAWRPTLSQKFFGVNWVSSGGTQHASEPYFRRFIFEYSFSPSTDHSLSLFSLFLKSWLMRAQVHVDYNLFATKNFSLYHIPIMYGDTAGITQLAKYWKLHYFQKRKGNCNLLSWCVETRQVDDKKLNVTQVPCRRAYNMLEQCRPLKFWRTRVDTFAFGNPTKMISSTLTWNRRFWTYLDVCSKFVRIDLPNTLIHASSLEHW